MSDFKLLEGVCPYCDQAFDDERAWQDHVDFCEDDLIEFANLGDPDE